MTTRRRSPAPPAPGADALFDAPLFLAPGHVLEQLRSVAQRLGEDPLGSQVLLAQRARHRLRGDTPPTDPSAFFFSFSGPSSEYTEDGIAIVRVCGTLFRGMFWDDYADIRGRIDEAIEDPEVRGILLDIDSPGGRVSGLFDLTRYLRSLVEANGKPIWAIANEQATSAAYAIGAATARMYVTPSGVVGSIGALCVHCDCSRMDRDMGMAFTEVASGARKTDLSPHRPLNAQGRDTLQAIVDAAAEQFFAEVSRYRGVAIEDLRAQEAAVYVGAGARDEGLVDAIANRDEVLDELRQQIGLPVSGPSGLPTLASPSPAFTAAVAAGGDENMADATRPAGEPAPTPQNPTPAAAPVAAAPPAAPPAAPVPPAPAASPAPDPVAAYQTNARLITNACALAGRPELAGEMIASNVTIEAAQRRLLELRASTDGESVNGVPSMAPAAYQQPVIDAAAVHRRWSDPKALAQHASATRR